MRAVLILRYSSHHLLAHASELVCVALLLLERLELGVLVGYLAIFVGQGLLVLLHELLDFGFVAGLHALEVARPLRIFTLHEVQLFSLHFALALLELLLQHLLEFFLLFRQGFLLLFV